MRRKINIEDDRETKRESFLLIIQKFNWAYLFQTNWQIKMAIRMNFGSKFKLKYSSISSGLNKNNQSVYLLLETKINIILKKCRQERKWNVALRMKRFFFKKEIERKEKRKGIMTLVKREKKRKIGKRNEGREHRQERRERR